MPTVSHRASPGRPAFGFTVPDNIAWLRAQHTKLVKATFLLAAIVLVLIGLVCVVAIVRPRPVYFATDPNLRVVPLTPLDQPTITDTGLLNWAGKVLIATLSLDYLHYRQTLLAVQAYYTAPAFNSLLASMKARNVLEIITQQSYDVSVTITGAPALEQEWVVGGRRYWRVGMPFIMSYHTSSGVGQSINLNAVMVIERVSESDDPQGVKVAQLVLSQQDAGG